MSTLKVLLTPLSPRDPRSGKPEDHSDIHVSFRVASWSGRRGEKAGGPRPNIRLLSLMKSENKRVRDLGWSSMHYSDLLGAELLIGPVAPDL